MKLKNNIFVLTLLLFSAYAFVLYGEDDNGLAIPIKEEFIKLTNPDSGTIIEKGDTCKIEWITRQFNRSSEPVEIELFSKGNKRVDSFETENTGEYIFKADYDEGHYYIGASLTISGKKLYDTTGMFRIKKKAVPKQKIYIKEPSGTSPLRLSLSVSDMAQEISIKGESDNAVYEISPGYSLLIEKMFGINSNLQVGFGIGLQAPVEIEEYEGSFSFYSGYGGLRFTRGKGLFSPYLFVKGGANFFSSDNDFKNTFYNQINSDIGNGTSNKELSYFAVGGIGVDIKEKFFIEAAYAVSRGNITSEGSDEIYIMDYSKINFSLGYNF